MMLSLEYFCLIFPLYLFQNSNNLLHQSQSTMSMKQKWGIAISNVICWSVFINSIWRNAWLTFTVYVWRSVQRISRGLDPFSIFYSHFVCGFSVHTCELQSNCCYWHFRKLQNLVTTLKNIVSTFSYVLMGLAMILNNLTTIHIICAYCSFKVGVLYLHI